MASTGKTLTFADYAIGAIPLVSGLVMGAICSTGPEAGADIPARPPSKAFGIVWPILYIGMGVSWVRSRSKDRTATTDILFGTLTGLLLLWQVLYGCGGRQKDALYVLAAGIAASLAATVYTSRLEASTSWLMSPLVAWLIFATMLNFEQVNRSARRAQ